MVEESHLDEVVDKELGRDLDNLNFSDEELEKMIELAFMQSPDFNQELFNEIYTREPERVGALIEKKRNDPELQERAEQATYRKLQRQDAEIKGLMSQNFTELGAIGVLNDREEGSQILQSGGKKILHFTDTEVGARDLEGRLQNLLQTEGIDPRQLLNGEKLPDNHLLVHTGDIGPDLFDIQGENRFRVFTTEHIIKEGELTPEEAEEFETLYREMMDQAGVTDELFVRGIRSEQDQQLFGRFQTMLYGIAEPQFMTEEELEEFRKKRAKLHKHLETAIENHSRKNLAEIKQVFDKYGFDESNFVIISGNHDVPHVVRDTFQGSYLDEGQTRTVNGVKFNRPLGTATGSVYGPNLAKGLMGSTDLVEQLPEMRYNSQSFQDLRNFVRDDLGFTHFTDQRIDELIRTSVQKSIIGFEDAGLKSINDRIEREVQVEIKSRLQRIDQTLDTSADVFLGHGDPTHPLHAGLDEVALREKLKDLGDQGKFYMGGHEHQETTNNFNNMFYVNPGSARQFSSGAVYIDSNNRFQSAKSFSIQGEDQRSHVNYRNQFQIPRQKVAEGGGGAGA